MNYTCNCTINGETDKAREVKVDLDLDQEDSEYVFITVGKLEVRVELEELLGSVGAIKQFKDWL